MGLSAFGGGDGPEELRADLEQLLALPETVSDALWHVVERHLGTTIAPGVHGLVSSFCAEYGISEDAILPVVRACRALFREAATRDVPLAEVTQDLNLLCGRHPDVVRRVSGWYERALPLIRTMMAIASLPSFGPVLEEARVRRSYLPTSQHLPNVLVPLLTLSLRYREGVEEKQLALQLSPEALERLRAVLSS